MYQNKLNGAVRVAFWMLYALLFCYYGSCLSSLYSIPMSYDPIIYGIVGNGWMEGLMPYRDLFDQKGPLIFLIYGISFLLFKSFWLVFLLEWAAIFVSMVFSYKIAVLFISARKAFFISLLLVLLLCNFPYYGGGGHPSEFLLPFQLASLYFLIRLRQGGRFSCCYRHCFWVEHGNSHFAEIQFGRLLVHPLYLCVHTGLEKRKGSAFSV